MGVNAQVYLAVARALHRFRGDRPAALATILAERGLAPPGGLRAIAASIAAPGSRRSCRGRARGGPGRGAEGLGGLERGRAVPGGEADEREARVDLRGGRDAAERGVGVAGDQRAVAGVEEGELAGRVAGRGVDLERADAVAGHERAGRAGLGAGVAAAQLRVRGLAGVGRLSSSSRRASRSPISTSTPGSVGDERVERRRRGPGARG